MRIIAGFEQTAIDKNKAALVFLNGRHAIAVMQQ